MDIFMKMVSVSTSQLTPNFCLIPTGPVRRDLRGADDDGREAADQHQAGDHQAEHGQADPGLRAALPEGTVPQG